MSDVTRESVHEQLQNHTIEVRLLQETEHGRYLHLRCSNNGSSNQMFNVLAVPGRLMYFGDMGSYVFERTNDMIAWFGADDGRDPDFRYLAEKVIAQDKSDGLKQKSVALFQQALESYLGDAEQDLHKEIKEEIERLTDLWEERGHEAAFYEACNFSICSTKKVGPFEVMDSIRFTFNDLWDFSFDEYTGRFLWACHALRWAIRRYWDMTEEKAAKS